MAPAAVMVSSALAPVCVNLVLPPGRRRQVGVCALNMWAYLAAYELPHDDPERLEARVQIDYPIAADRVLGLGVPPTLRLQHTFSRPGQINRFERLLVWCHWVWFMVPHASVAYVLLRRPERFPGAAARMYATFDIGAVFYWALPTAPPWYAARHGRLGGEEPPALGGGDPPAWGGGEPPVRRMMIEYGEEFWGGRWPDLYDVLGGNPLAAMPSLHFATSLMGAHLLTEAGPVAGAVGFTYTALLGLALVYLGEHYAADLLGGAVLAESVRRAEPRMVAPARAWLRALNGLQALASGG
jgi:membrane-associated phospholipid phosphatase